MSDFSPSISFSIAVSLIFSPFPPSHCLSLLLTIFLFLSRSLPSRSPFLSLPLSPSLSLSLFPSVGLNVLHCVDQDAVEGATPCSIALDDPYGNRLKQSVLLRTYIEMDSTHKIRDFIVLLRAFVREQGIVGENCGIEENDPSGQKTKNVCLSTYAWTVLALHTLLRFQILPNIHSKGLISDEISEESSASPRSSVENVPKDVMMTYATPNIQRNVLYRKIMNIPNEIDVASDGDVTTCDAGKKSEKENNEKVKKDFFSLSYSDKINDLSILNLFQLFFGYLDSSVDVYGTVLTMRNDGEVCNEITVFLFTFFFAVFIFAVVSAFSFFQFFFLRAQNFQ